MTSSRFATTATSWAYAILSEDGYITPKRMMDPESFAAFVKSEGKS